MFPLGLGPWTPKEWWCQSRLSSSARGFRKTCLGDNSDSDMQALDLLWDACQSQASERRRRLQIKGSNEAFLLPVDSEG